MHFNNILLNNQTFLIPMGANVLCHNHVEKLNLGKNERFVDMLQIVNNFVLKTSHPRGESFITKSRCMLVDKEFCFLYITFWFLIL